MRKNHSKIVCIKLVHLPYLCNSNLLLQHRTYVQQFGVADSALFSGLHILNTKN